MSEKDIYVYADWREEPELIGTLAELSSVPQITEEPGEPRLFLSASKASVSIHHSLANTSVLSFLNRL